MNTLLVSGERLNDVEVRNRYFEDLVKWGFDVVCATYDAQTYDEVTGGLKAGYAAFAEEARQHGYPVCVRIESTLCDPAEMDIAEAQYKSDNTPDVRSDGKFFASFASEKWKDYLKNITRVFVEDYGYEWVLYGEPILRADIPGSMDPLYAVFQERFPDVDYPAAHSETAAYIKVQKVKADILVEFYADLVSYAKSVGAKKVGASPLLFTPTVENTPPETLNTSCDIGRIAELDDVDFLMAGMQPDHISAGAMRTGDEIQQSPLLRYVEVLAHALGKPVVVSSASVSKGAKLPKTSPRLMEKSLLAAMAAAPSGTARNADDQSSEAGAEEMKFVSGINRHINRLGDLVSPVAFVFSYRGGRHAEPYTYETAWRQYWALGKQMLFEEKLPMRTIYADALAKNLESSSDLRVVVLDERFPLSIAQAQILGQWWHASPKRAVVAFGQGLGYSADEDRPGDCPLVQSFSEILQSLGVRQQPQPQERMPAGKARIKHVFRLGRTAFLGDGFDAEVDRIAKIERIFGSRSTALYAEQHTETPVIIQYHVGQTIGLFCGLGLSQATAPIAANIVRYALEHVDAPEQRVASDSPGLLWNSTRSGYVIVANTSDTTAEAELLHKRSVAWDVVDKKMLFSESGSLPLTLEPVSFRLFRLMGKRSKMCDIVNACYVTSIIDGAGRADVSAFTGSSASFIVRTPPSEARVDGRLVRFTTRRIADADEVTIEGVTMGDHMFTLRW